MESVDQATDITEAAEQHNYDRAFRMVAAIYQAAASEEFHAGVIAGYGLLGHPSGAAKFTAAVEVQRQRIQDDAEFGDDTDGSDD
jgi:hypothetical protein